MVASNSILYSPGEHPDHVVVIKYVPSVGDSKRAMDEYTSEIFLNGRSTIAIHNTCEDSLLAAPLILDFVILTELCERILICKETGNTSRGSASNVKANEDVNKKKYERMHSMLSILSYLTKAPAVPRGTPVVNALFQQREAIVNLLRACIGLPPDNHMMLEHKLRSHLTAATAPDDRVPNGNNNARVVDGFHSSSIHQCVEVVSSPSC